MKGAKSAKSINKLSSLILIIEVRSTERDGSIYNQMRKYEIMFSGLAFPATGAWSRITQIK